ncbi:N-acetyltransferase family protein [Streptomyces flaveolus]|uniref:GNAT family N-acetyltransferase n=1 Tax=Streptomyces flaveolus TaxID=67297 RepID=UPI003F540033
MPEVRPFRCDDRDQLTDLVNAHVAAVVPGVSVNTVLSSLEREPEEVVTDPWVGERVTLVAEEHGHVVAAAHLKWYRAGEETGPHYQDAGEIDWFLWRPSASFRPGTEQAADLLMGACLACLARWRVRVRRASGDLPAPAVYGLPRPWPHVRALHERAGFRHTGATEVILLARTATCRAPSRTPGSRSNTRWGSAAPASPPARTRASSASSGPTPSWPAPNATRAGQAWPTSTTCTSSLDAGFHELTRTDRGWEHHPR